MRFWEYFMDIKTQLISNLNSTDKKHPFLQGSTSIEATQISYESVSVEMSFNQGEMRNVSGQNLLYKNAVEAIDKYFHEKGGVENKTEKDISSGIDYSPEATAERIVQFGTGFFHIYQQNHPDESYDEAKENFTNIIQDAIDLGFKEARDVLASLDVLNGEIASNIDKTYEHVLLKMDEFLNA